MSDVNEGGWLYLTDGANKMWLACESIEVDIKDEIVRERVPGDDGWKFSLKEIYREVKAENVHFTSHTNLHNCIDNLINWNYAGAFTLKIIRTSTPDYSDIFGSGSTTLTVLFEDVKGIHKESRGNTQHWIIKQMRFVE